MKRLVVAVSTAAVLTAGTFTAVADPGQGLALGHDKQSGTLRAGVAAVDATWHVGAGGGQYASDETAEFSNPTQAEWDPNVEHVKQASTYGVASRLSARALVLQSAGGSSVALVKVDNYLAQDMLSRRVAQLLAAHGSSVTYDHLLISATHDHNSPYYSSPAWGVWLFQDVMDLRMFEYQARVIARAVERAEHAMVPASVGATTVQVPEFQSNIAGADTDADGSPAGYPKEENDHGAVVLRVDDLSNPHQPKPLATYVNYAMHGESLDGYDLISGDWTAPFERFVDRGTGSTTVFSQGSVGSAEGPYDSWYSRTNQPVVTDGGDTVPKAWSHEAYAQAERGAHVLASKVIAAWQAIGGAHNGVPVQVPPTAAAPVAMVTHFVAGPLSHPYPSVSNCRTRQSLDGDPGVPVLGLPDCERWSSGSGTGQPLLPFTTGLYDQLRAFGIPVPANYDASAFTAVEENLRLKLQAVRIGDVFLGSCACEPQSDLIKALETRTDADPATMWNGFDYANQDDVDAAWPVQPTLGGGQLPAQHVRACYTSDGKTYSCPNPGDVAGERRLTMTKAAFDHMEAEINNDAKGWDDPNDPNSDVALANGEPTTVSAIKGNFTHVQLGAGTYAGCSGFTLPVGLGHSGDYNGYTVSYREYMARDSYRKALTSYGPHTADYMVTRLVEMAANLKCGTPLPPEPTDPIAAADEARQQAEATLLGQVSSAAYDGWTAQVPDDKGPAGVVAQPKDIQRFDAASLTWVGGDNWTDNPTVRVERLRGKKWLPYADQSGEVVTQLNQPPAAWQALVDNRTGNQQWTWTASFEAFDSYPRADVPDGQVADGTYRFVVDGAIHQGGGVARYHLASNPFTVSAWTGLTAQPLTVSGGKATLVTDPVVYPRTYTSPIRFIKDDGNGPTGNLNTGLVCKTCSFRPWATTGQVASVMFTVTSADGSTRQVQGTSSDGGTTWTASGIQSGEAVTVAPGAIRDTYGETNALSYRATA